MTIELKIDYYNIKILIDNLPHISLDRRKYLGFQSWTDGSYFSIEFYMKGNTILTEQDSKEKWMKILKVLNEKL